LGEYYP